MDTSKEYVEMCDKAEEIQALRNNYEKWQVGDYSTTENMAKHRPEMPYTVLGEQEDAPYDVCNPVFLPRQDQLQEMVNDGADTLSRLQGVWIFVNSYKLTPISMEQLWLAYVMKLRYSKEWNGNEWAK